MIDQQHESLRLLDTATTGTIKTEKMATSYQVISSFDTNIEIFVEKQENKRLRKGEKYI